MSSLTHVRGRVGAIGGVIVLLLVAGVWFTLTHASAQSSVSNHRTTASNGGSSKPKAHSSSRIPSEPLQLVSETPASKATGVSGTTDIKIRFSVPLAADSPLPRLKPHVPGQWQGAGTSTLEFVPSRGFAQLTRVKVTIPGGALGVRSTDGALLGKSVKLEFRTGSYQTARLAELLAQLEIGRAHV